MKFSKTTLIALVFTFTACAQKNKTESEQISKEDYTNVDYSIASNIIDPDTLKQGSDERKIFYNPSFLKLTHEETKNLEPIKVKDEFAKLGIVTDDRKRFVEAYSFFITYYRGHKKSCEQWESFKDLAPESKN